MRGALAFVVLVVLGVECRAGEALPPAWLDAEADRVTARADVPDPVRKLGEVRLVQRGDAVVVQTLLLTTALSRVVAEIRQKETANWPAGAPGHEDMERYAAAIERVADGLRDARDPRAADRRLRLLIELVAAPGRAGLIVGTFDGAFD